MLGKHLDNLRYGITWSQLKDLLLFFSSFRHRVSRHMACHRRAVTGHGWFSFTRFVKIVLPTDYSLLINEVTIIIDNPNQLLVSHGGYYSKRSFRMCPPSKVANVCKC